MLRFIVTGFAVTMVIDPAFAKINCASREIVLDHLQRQYQETPIAAGRANNGGTVEVFTNSSFTTWTIMITMPDGRTCMMAAGDSWHSLAANTLHSLDPGA
jgi:hypothetical protein